jgi:hypothetical protein
MRILKKAASAAAVCAILMAMAPVFIPVMLVYARCHGGGDVKSC